MTRHCPAGDGSFDDWIETCPECGRNLTAIPPADVQGTASASGLVWLVTAPNEPEAQMWADTIRGDGIPVFVKAGGPGVGAWASASSFEHELFVRERDLFKARRITKSMFSRAASLGRDIPRRSSVPRGRSVRKGAKAPAAGSH
jgi:hypothetical protein